MPKTLRLSRHTIDKECQRDASRTIFTNRQHLLGGNIPHVRLLQPMSDLSHKEHKSLINDTVESIGYYLAEGKSERVKTLMWELDVKHLLNFAMEDDEPVHQLGEPEHDPCSHHHPNNH